MARASPVQYKMYYRVSFETVIRGHHVYKQSWKPEINQVLHREEDKRADAKEYDTNAIGVYVTHERPDAENTLAGHVPIEISRSLTFFLQANADNLLTATVTVVSLADVFSIVTQRSSALRGETKNGCEGDYSYREEKEGGWSCRTGKAYSLHARTEEREDFEERTE